MSKKSFNQETENDLKALLEAFEAQQESINSANAQLFEAVGDKIRRLEKSVAEEHEKEMIPSGANLVLHHAKFTMNGSENVTNHINKGIAQVKKVLNLNEEAKAQEKAQENAEAREKAKATGE